MLNQWPDYELLDFGGGQKLERFGDRILSRPIPASDRVPLRHHSWNADAEFVLLNRRSVHQRGRWESSGWSKPNWNIGIGPMTMQLKLTAFGHIGLFPEHFQHWQWALAKPEALCGRQFLNLFAYTGAFSLLLASAGAKITHVDASGAAVRWAKKNAELSGLTAAPIRWMVEDAMRFVHREIKRGSRYDGFVVDAPTFGRGPRKETWKIDRDLSLLLDMLKELMSEHPCLILVSSHTPGFDARRLQQLFRNAFGTSKNDGLEAAELFQSDGLGRLLPNGSFVRWQR